MVDAMSDRQRVFERLYERDCDPWGLDSSPYERDKRDATLAALPPRRFRRAIEIGCATGVLSERLLETCDHLIAVDISATALNRARNRLATRRAVEFVAGEVPYEWPPGTYDLVVLSEVLYFLDAGEIAEVSRLSHDSLATDGVCLLVNWTGENDLPIDGHRAVEIFRESAGWVPGPAIRHPSYRIDIFVSE